ncbi:MAG TPA: hypothetical protein PKD63_04390 [Solirubrobacteraceae bacterium]|nr:hypothetical protein [Solirubrobacteraceae bacterium]
MTDTDDTASNARRGQLRKWLTLAGLAVVGMCMVTIPVILALVLSQ